MSDPALSAPAPGVRVLVVDDEVGVRTLLSLALRRQGFDVLLAAGGEEAVALYRHHGEGIGLVLMDVELGGLDGLDTLAQLRQLNPALPCCLMSGNPGQYDGIGQVLSKPFTTEELLQALWEAALSPV